LTLIFAMPFGCTPGRSPPACRSHRAKLGGISDRRHVSFSIPPHQFSACLYTFRDSVPDGYCQGIDSGARNKLAGLAGALVIISSPDSSLEYSPPASAPSSASTLTPAAVSHGNHLGGCFHVFFQTADSIRPNITEVNPALIALDNICEGFAMVQMQNQRISTLRAMALTTSNYLVTVPCSAGRLRRRRQLWDIRAPVRSMTPRIVS